MYARRISLSPEALAALVGCGIDYTGDMANPSGVGAIVAVSDDKWGQRVDVVLEDGRRIDRFPLAGCATPDMRNGCAYRIILTGPARDADYIARLEAAAILRTVNLAAAAQVSREQFERAEAARAIPPEAAPLFYWNGIKDDRGAKLQRAHYSIGGLANHPDGTITIYARDYGRFSEKVRACFVVLNDTDTMTDYFDTDRIRVIPSHPLYSQVKAAADAQSAHWDHMRAKREAKRRA